MPEEEAFCVFVRLMQEYRLRELFKPSMAELGLCIYQFEYLLQVKRKQCSLLMKMRLAVWESSTEGQQIIYLCVQHTVLGLYCVYLSLMIFLFSSIPGATSWAERAFSVPEFPHIHVRLVLVPYSFPHLPPSPCRHTHFWYIHVWGRKYTNYTHKLVFFMYLMCLTVYFQCINTCIACIEYMTCLQGLEIIFRVGLAILQYNQTDLIQLDMEGMSQVSSCSFTPLVAEISFVYRFNHEWIAPQRPTFPFAQEFPERQICFPQSC